jgi:hypothetical protein
MGLARRECGACQGSGIRLDRKRKEVPCHCVLRAIFRACYRQFRDCADRAACTGSSQMEYRPGREGRRVYTRALEDFMADFCLVSRRVLDDLEYRLFRFHFLLGGDAKLCCRRLGLSRWMYFSQLRRLQQKLGRTFAELEPFSLYPVEQYFRNPVRKEAPPRLRVLDRGQTRQPISA